MTTEVQRRNSQSWQDRLREGTITPEELLAASLPDQQRVVGERYRSPGYRCIARYLREEEILNGLYLRLHRKVVVKKEMPKDAEEWLKWMDQNCWGVGRDLRRQQLRHASKHDESTLLESETIDHQGSELDSDKIGLPLQLVHYFAIVGIITRREAEVLERWILMPHAKWKDIASELGIGVDGVKKHHASAKKKIGLIYAMLQHDLCPEAGSPLHGIGLPPSLLAPFLEPFTRVILATMQTWPEFVDKPDVIDWSKLRPELEVASGLRLLRRITKTEGCEFWIAEHKDDGTIGVKIRPITDVRWLIDFWMDFIIRKEGKQLPGEMSRYFQTIPLRQTICWPWIINHCELAEWSALDVLAACHKEGKPGIDGQVMLPLLMRTVWEICFLNETNLSHRNISPTNLVLTANRLRLCDFGDVAWRDTDFPNLVSTPYQAPEVVAGKPHKRSDQYSFAMTYYYLRTGKLPFKNLPEARANEEPDLSLVTEPEREVLGLALSHDPSGRLDFTVGVDKLMSITNW